MNTYTMTAKEFFDLQAIPAAWVNGYRITSMDTNLSGTEYYATVETGLGPDEITATNLDIEVDVFELIGWTAKNLQEAFGRLPDQLAELL